MILAWASPFNISVKNLGSNSHNKFEHVRRFDFLCLNKWVVEQNFQIHSNSYLELLAIYDRLHGCIMKTQITK